MGRQLKITFEKFGSVIADMLEEEAPVTCQVIWDSLEEPWSEKIIHSKLCGCMCETPYFPVPEDYILPNENLTFIGSEGEISVVAPAEWRENSIKGYLPMFFSHGSFGSPITHLTGVVLEKRNLEKEALNWTYYKNMWETCRANVFAKVRDEDLETLKKACFSARYEDILDFTIERA